VQRPSYGRRRPSSSAERHDAAARQPARSAEQWTIPSEMRGRGAVATPPVPRLGLGAESITSRAGVGHWPPARRRAPRAPAVLRPWRVAATVGFSERRTHRVHDGSGSSAEARRVRIATRDKVAACRAAAARSFADSRRGRRPPVVRSPERGHTTTRPLPARSLGEARSAPCGSSGRDRRGERRFGVRRHRGWAAPSSSLDPSCCSSFPRPMSGLLWCRLTYSAPPRVLSACTREHSGPEVAIASSRWRFRRRGNDDLRGAGLALLLGSSLRWRAKVVSFGLYSSEPCWARSCASSLQVKSFVFWYQAGCNFAQCRPSEVLKRSLLAARCPAPPRPCPTPSPISTDDRRADEGRSRKTSLERHRRGVSRTSAGLRSSGTSPRASSARWNTPQAALRLFSGAVAVRTAYLHGALPTSALLDT